MRIAGDTFSRGRTFLQGVATGSLRQAAPICAPATDRSWLTSTDETPVPPSKRSGGRSLHSADCPWVRWCGVSVPIGFARCVGAMLVVLPVGGPQPCPIATPAPPAGPQIFLDSPLLPPYGLTGFAPVGGALGVVSCIALLADTHTFSQVSLLSVCVLRCLLVLL